MLSHADPFIYKIVSLWDSNNNLHLEVVCLKYKDFYIEELISFVYGDFSKSVIKLYDRFGSSLWHY